MAQALRIFAVMKSKLTLSISPARVRRVKSYSLRRKKSVSQIIEEFIDGLEPAKGGAKRSAKPKKKYLIERYAGMLTGRITQEDLDRDPRLAHIYRKGL
jgi:hypothetical protein